MGKQIRLLILTWIIRLALWVTPKECKETLKWLGGIPLEDLTPTK